MATQTERIAVLEAQLLALQETLHTLHALVNQAVAPLAEEVVRAHARIDHAGDVFTALRKAVTPLHTKREAPQRIPRAEFDRALNDLRDEVNNDRATFTRDAILERAATLRVMAANTQAAA
jgi:hypothetical protein